MTKSELILKISRTYTFIPSNHIEIIVEYFFETIKKSLSEGEKVELRGFGTFYTRVKEPRKARNPKTGESVSVPRRVAPCFKPGKYLKEELLKIKKKK